jgi:hypothetical protein
MEDICGIVLANVDASMVFASRADHMGGIANA